VEMMTQPNYEIFGSILGVNYFTLFSLFKPSFNLMELTIYSVYYTINGSVEMMIQLNSVVSGSIPGHKLFFCLNQILTSIPCRKFFYFIFIVYYTINSNLMELTIYSIYYTINGSVEMMIQLRGCLGLLQLQIFFWSWWSRSSLAPEICGAGAVGIQESSV
jgi:hypothetical protein